ncbi:hypothetical protein Q73_00340, partial [Bacillus coahuilensis m2-6]|uniref:DUF4238 domain-containing protein n=1 Tax=Bacillus coahuilensis TaxID=408580 RepID=UPI00079692B4
MNKSTVAKQHYVPKFILKNFSNAKEQLFEALLEMKRVYQTKTTNSMCERFIYEHSELEKNRLETFFSEIESELAPKIEKIKEILSNEENSNIISSSLRDCI